MLNETDESVIEDAPLLAAYPITQAMRHTGVVQSRMAAERDYYRDWHARMRQAQSVVREQSGWRR